MPPSPSLRLITKREFPSNSGAIGKLNFLCAGEGRFEVPSLAQCAASLQSLASGAAPRHGLLFRSPQSWAPLCSGAARMEPNPMLWCDPSSPAKLFRWKLVLENPVPNSFDERKGRSAAGAPFLRPKDSFHDAFYPLYFYNL